MEGKTGVRNWGNLSPKLGEVAPDFDSRFGGKKPLIAGVVTLRSSETGELRYTL